MRKLLTITFLLVLTHFCFSQQTFVKRFNRSIVQYSKWTHGASLFNINNFIYYGGQVMWYAAQQGQGYLDIQKIDLNGNLVWAKNYKIEGGLFTDKPPKIFQFKGSIYSVTGMSDGTNTGINVTKYDTTNGSIIYSKNIGLFSYPIASYDFGQLTALELDTAHLLFSCYGHLIKYNAISNSVVSVNYLESNNYPLFLNGDIIRNSDYSLIMQGYLDNPPQNTFMIKVKNDGSFNSLGAIKFGLCWQLFKKNSSRLLTFGDAFYSPTSWCVIELDTSLGITKCMKPNQLFDPASNGFFVRNNKMHLHSNSLDLILDSSYNCLQSRNEFLPWDFSGTYCGWPLYGPNLFLGNGIYSVRTNSCGLDNNRVLFIRSDSNFVNPCNTVTTPIVFTQTNNPVTSNFTFNILPITPTVSIPNYTITNLVIPDSTYCTTTTDIKTSEVSQYKLMYTDRSVNINSDKWIQRAVLFDIFGRKIRKLEGIQDLEIPYGSQAPGIYFVEMLYSDNTVSRVKILLY